MSFSQDAFGMGRSARERDAVRLGYPNKTFIGRVFGRRVVFRARCVSSVGDASCKLSEVLPFSLTPLYANRPYRQRKLGIESVTTAAKFYLPNKLLLSFDKIKPGGE